MYTTIGVFAHVDSGKTTFAEQLLFETQAIKEKGRVDHQSAFLDYHSIERQRGITVFAEQATFQYRNRTYYLIDTPGHIDFSTEMERAMGVMDYAIIMISAVEGVQGHTETIWKLLRHYKVPTFIFINKMDREGADANKVVAQLERSFKSSFFLFEDTEEFQLTDVIVEAVAETDEKLLMSYLEGDESIDWLDSLQNQIKNEAIFPVFKGSALKGSGILSFLNHLDALTATDYDEEAPFRGQVYKIRYNEKGERLTHLKIESGILKVKEEINLEKINELRFYSGAKYETTNQAKAGQLVVATGLTSDLHALTIQPTLRVSVLHENPKELLGVLRQLEAEDPSLRVEWVEMSQSITISVMGTIQLEVLKEMMLERFGEFVDFGPREVIYLETVAERGIGRGHYEPLKHYAEVHVRLEPGPRGSGIVFESECHVHQLGQSSQNLVKQHVLEQTPVGILTGSALADMKVTLLTGAIHEKHTHGGDLLEATSRAIRQGLEKIQSQLLEPYYEVKIEVELTLMGRVLTDIQKAAGTFETPEMGEESCRIVAKVPVATFMDYPIEFLSYTKGRGHIHLRVAGYDVCHNSVDVIERINYNKDADRRYPSASIFCAKGSGFVVPWDEADDYMHLRT